MQQLLHDRNISTFLKQIPIKQQIITLKQLIYIGIKIVTNSFQTDNKDKLTNHNFHNKQVIKQNYQFNKENSQGNFQKTQGKRKNYQIQHKKTTHQNNSQKGIQSTLLREISKIRMQLESLTNKVYDHCFDEQQKNNNFEEDSFELNNQQHGNYGYQQFHNSQNLPTFQASKHDANPSFQRHSKNFFRIQPENSISTPNPNPKHPSNHKPEPSQPQRNHSHSNIMHLDDTQIRQALYKQSSQRFNQHNQSNRFKKSKSVIQVRREQKKKEQDKYFYQQNVEKERLQQLEQYKKVKQTQLLPQRDHLRGQSAKQNIKSIKNPYQNKVKSKIKNDVQRDRLLYKKKMDEYNFKKGFQQYQFSANQLQQQNEHDDQEQQNEQPQNQQQHQHQPRQQNRPSNHYNNQSNHSNNALNYIRSSQSPSNFMQQPHFYQSNQSSPLNQQNTFSQNQVEHSQQENINVHSNSSSFSQFSMEASRRQAGKISRRK